MTRHPMISFAVLIAWAVALLAAWTGLRGALETRMAAAAQRGLETIAELVAAELSYQAGPAGNLRGEALLHSLVAQRPDFIRAVRSAEASHFRRIYFYDAGGRVLHVGTTVAVLAGTEIVRGAIARTRDTSGAWRGAVLDAYPDAQREDVIGVWLWRPEAGLGVVAERPYARFAQPLRWFDAAYAGFAGLLSVALLALARRYVRQAHALDAVRHCGPYELIGPLGDGSMGQVHLARHRHLRRDVALKRLKLYARSDETVARFEREARLASQLAHPNIVTILDHGCTPDGGFYYTMEYIRGLTLTQWVERHGALPPERALHVLLQVCAAVAAMHRRRLLHRDIKPDNIMVYATPEEADRVKLLDFGLIKDCRQSASRDLTRSVRVLGTPAFMAPERLADPGRVDQRSDLYGIACVGFYLLTGRRPFESGQACDLTQQVLHMEAPRLSRYVSTPLPAGLEALIAQSLAKNPDLRPASVAALREHLLAIAADCPWHADAAAAWWRGIKLASPTAGGTHGLDVSLTMP